MHPLTVDIGVPWTDQFFKGKKGWERPENIVRSIDQFLAATIAYGHMGWLVEEEHGIRQTCRSYYMLQQLQSRYLMEKPSAIRYGTDAGLVSSSRAFLDGSWKENRIQIDYANGIRLWINGNEKQGLGHRGQGWQICSSPLWVDRRAGSAFLRGIVPAERPESRSRELSRLCVPGWT